MKISLHICAVILSTASFLVLTQQSAIACECDSAFLLKFKFPAAPEQRLPAAHAFQVHHEISHGQNKNQCRRDARNDAHHCMRVMWENRNRFIKPAACSGELHNGQARLVGIKLPWHLQRRIEREVCKFRQAKDTLLGAEHQIDVEVFSRTGGGKGCGPNLKKSENKKLGVLKIDCIHVRYVEKGLNKPLGPIYRSTRSLEPFTDRPGSNIAGSPASDNTARSCAKACDRTHGCVSWTFVPRQMKGCWLKNTIPKAVRSNISNIISGTCGKRQHRVGTRCDPHS